MNLPNLGRIPPQIWREVEIDFRNCVRELPHMGKKEIGECVKGKLAGFIVIWLVNREMDRNKIAHGEPL